MTCNKAMLLPHCYFNFVLEFVIRRVQANQEGLKLNGRHQLFVYVVDLNMLGGRVHNVKENWSFYSR